MSLPLLIEQRDLEMVIGAQRVAQLLDNRGAGRANASIVADILQAGTDEGARFLAPGFSTDEIIALARADASIRRKLARIGIGEAAMGRPEFTGPNGEFLFQKPYEMARKDLMEMGTSKQRSAAEQQIGAVNRRIGPRVGLRKHRPRSYVFADSPERKGGGPF